MKRNMHMLLGCALVAMLMVPAVAAAEQEQIQITGSTTVGPIADAFVEAFKTIAPKTEITVTKSGSGNGAKALVDGTCQIATLSRFMKPEEFKKAVDNGIMPVAHVVAMDGVAMVVHPSNPIKDLTKEQIQKIYTGKVTNWKQLGGPDKEIVKISRDTSSGTFETFHKLAMEGEKIVGAKMVGSNPEMHKAVSGNTAAVGYLGLGFVDAKVKALTVEGVTPKEKTIVSGKYPISRPLFMFTNGYPKLGSTVHAFVTFYLTEKGQEIVREKGFIPMTNY